MPVRDLESYRREYLDSVRQRVPYRLDTAKYKEIFSLVPRTCVDAIVEGPNKSVLLALRNIDPQNGSWHFPGGVIRYGVEPEQMLEEKVKAEVGLEIKVKRVLDVYGDPLNDRKFWTKENGWQVLDNPEIFTHSIATAYIAEIVGGSLSSTPETKEARFFSLDDLPNVIGFYHKEALDDYKELLYRQI